MTPFKRKRTCHRPPAGWYCTRPRRHDGPCAAKQPQLSVTVNITGDLDDDELRERIQMILLEENRKLIDALRRA